MMLSIVSSLNRKNRLERRKSRLAFLQDAFANLDHGLCVTHTTLRLALTSGEMKAYLQTLRTKLTVPNDRERRVLQNYKKQLRLADRKFASAAKLRSFGPKAMKRHILIRDGQGLYNHAQDWITELVAGNSALNYLFDRIVREDEIDDEPEGMPRLISSNSEFMRDPRDNHWYALLCSLQSEALRDSLETLA